MRGPIDYIIVGFKNQKFDGSILKALGDAIDAGTINLLALSGVAKDADGTVTTIDMFDTADDYFVEFNQKYKTDASLVDKEDIDEVADLLEENEAAGLLIIEHLWAKPLKQAIVNAGGFLIADGRIHSDAAGELED